jgi:hypothetical protein
MGMWWFRRRAAEQTAADLLDQCLARIERGEATLESCLAEHPEQAAELRPLLLTALATRSVAAQGPTGAAYARMRARVLAAAAPRPMPVKRRPMWQPVATAGLALAFLMALAVPLSALQTSDAVPGDWDYGLKRAGERVRLAVTVNDADRREVHLALAERREREIQALLEQNRTEQLEAAIQAFASEHASLQNSLSNNAISAPEAERIAATVDRQAKVLEQIVQDAPLAAAAAALDASKQASRTRDEALRSQERREQPPAPTPPPAAQNRATPTPTPTPVSSTEPSASPSATAESGESPTPSPSPSGSPSPSDSPTPTPSASPIASPAPSAVAPIGTPVTPAASQQSPTPTRTPAPLPTTPLPVPNTTAPLPSTTPTGTPLPTLAPVIPGPITPRPSASPSLAPTPVPTPTPEPTPPSRSSTEVPAPGVTLVPGIARNFVYTGPEQALLSLLEPAAGKYTYVSFRTPSGQTVTYRPGDPGGAAFNVAPGSEVIIIVTDTVTLRW